MKINVVGTSGSGKSTFSRRLAAQLAIPYIEMDALFWQPNWTPSSDAEFFARLEQALAQAHWVLDGNYHRSCGIKWRQAQMIVWLDYSLTRTLWQATARAWRRSWRQQEIWPGTGNRESFRRSFLNRESVVLWTLKTYRSNRRRYLAIQQDPRYRHVQFVPLRSPRQAERFLSQLTASVRRTPGAPAPAWRCCPPLWPMCCFQLQARAGTLDLMLVTFLLTVSATLLKVGVLHERLPGTALAGMVNILLVLLDRRPAGRHIGPRRRATAPT